MGIFIHDEKLFNSSHVLSSLKQKTVKSVVNNGNMQMKNI